MSGSWKTSAVGIATAVTMLAGQVIALLDGDPKTVVDIEVIVAALGVLGIGWFARDNNVTSAKAGAK